MVSTLSRKSVISLQVSVGSAAEFVVSYNTVKTRLFPALRRRGGDGLSCPVWLIPALPGQTAYAKTSVHFSGKRTAFMADNTGLMRGKRGVILGVANNRSIAYGIAKSCRDQGAELALTWQGDALKKRVEPLAKELGAITRGHCDVTDTASIDAVFAV